MTHTLIIAEAGVNHNGSLALAKQLIDKAVEAGVDIIKFQTFKSEKLVSKAAKQAEYQQRNIGKQDEDQLAMLKKLELSQQDHEVLIAYCNEQGIALADQYDREVLQCIILASRDTETFAGSGAGSSVTDADLATDADILAGALMSAGQKMDEMNVPESPRFAAFKPALYWLLLQSDLVINRDYSNGGNVQKGKVWELAGIEILKSNNVPSTNISSGITKYQGNFTKTKGVVWHPQAAGTVKLMDLALESEYLITHQGTLMVAKYAVGHDSLRPEGAVEIALP